MMRRACSNAPMLLLIFALSCSRRSPPGASPAAEPGRLPVLVPQRREPPAWSRDACPIPQATGIPLDSAVSSGAIESGVLVCSLRLSEEPPRGRRWDLLGNPPDPMVELQIGGQPVQERACGQDTYQTLLTWPGIDLPVGASIKAHVYDLDLNYHDDVGVSIETYGGAWPVALSGSHFSMQCGALSRAEAEARVPEQVEAALRSVVLLEEASLSPTAPDWGYPRAMVSGLRRRIEAVAGLVTWSDPRAGGLLALHDDGIAVWLARASADVAAHRAQTPDEVVIEGLSVRVEGADCGEGGCTVAVTLSWAGEGSAAPIPLSGWDGLSLSGVRDDGADITLSLRSIDGVVVEGVQEELVATLPARLELVVADAPVLVRAMFHRERRLLRVP